VNEPICASQTPVDVYFSDFFQVPPSLIEEYGAFNISLLSDLPLFIDPFLLFTSRKPQFRKLHDEIIEYLRFLRDKSTSTQLESGLIHALYTFHEVRQTWLGFSTTSNRGIGLGNNFAGALHRNLGKIFGSFGNEQITRASHLEKLCLIESGVGRDKISDFTTNLILKYLVEYTEVFARKHIQRKFCRKLLVRKCRFDYRTETWVHETHYLPAANSDFVLLTPKEILTKDDTWINRSDLIREFDGLPESIPDDQLRAEVNNYFLKQLPKKPTSKEKSNAAASTILRFPELIDYFIRYKEDHASDAASLSAKRVELSRQLYIEQFKQLAQLLASGTSFYATKGNTYKEAMERVRFLKDVIENKGGHRIFYVKGKPLEREEDLHILYRLTWYASALDVSREVNDGRGPVDFKLSNGSEGKTLVEFKLAKNTQLKRNLEKQTPVYEKASDARKSIKVIIFFSAQERKRAEGIVKSLKLDNDPNIILIDARRDNKPPGSKA